MSASSPMPMREAIFPCPALGVHLRGEQIGLHAALFIVMRRLQQQGRFSGIHRGVVEVELSHMVMCPEREGDARGRGPTHREVRTAFLAPVMVLIARNTLTGGGENVPN